MSRPSALSRLLDEQATHASRGSESVLSKPVASVNPRLDSPDGVKVETGPTPCAPFPWSAAGEGDVLIDASQASGPTRLTSRPRRSLGLSHHPVIGQTDLQLGKRHDCAMNQTRLSCQLERAHLMHTCSVLGLVTFGGISHIEVLAVGLCIVSAVRCRTPVSRRISTKDDSIFRGECIN